MTVSSVNLKHVVRERTQKKMWDETAMCRLRYALPMATKFAWLNVREHKINNNLFKSRSIRCNMNLSHNLDSRRTKEVRTYDNEN